MVAVLLIFMVTYAGLAVGKWPWLRTDRAGIALVGAAAMLAVSALSFDEAWQAVDGSTLVLLLGMMIVTAYLSEAGLFKLLSQRLGRHAQNSHAFLALVVCAAGGLSAFLVNDVVCIALTPLVLSLCQAARKPPIPYLVALATSANIGSVATITGNPQNIIIGSLSQISYGSFFCRLAPVALVGLGLNYAVLALVYRSKLREPATTAPAVAEPKPLKLRLNRLFLAKAVAVTLAAVAAFFAGGPIAVTALIAAAVMLLGGLRPKKIYARIDWPLLVMFAGLFVVVHAFEVHVVRRWDLAHWQALLHSPVVLMSLSSVVLSNLVSNVPAVLLYKPLLAVMPEAKLAWLALAMSSTLAGNLTVLGSVANLIVVEAAAKAGTRLGFGEYLKVGVPVTVVTTGAGIAWLLLTS